MNGDTVVEIEPDDFDTVDSLWYLLHRLGIRSAIALLSNIRDQDNYIQRISG